MDGGYPYHIDGDHLACGKVDFNETYGTHVGTIYYWKGKRYGITHYRYNSSHLYYTPPGSLTANYIYTWLTDENEVPHGAYSY